MLNKNLIDTFDTKEENALETLVENRTSYSFDQCELNLFETHQNVENVKLVFDHFVLTSMLSGKKIMKLPDTPAFDYLPGESVILPPGQLMNIDFPEAELGNPTQCIALTISDAAIRNTLDLLNEESPKEPTWGEWEIDSSIFHLTNNIELSNTINRIIRITKSEKGKVKDVMVELAIKEMLVRLMQTQAKQILQTSYKKLVTNNSLAAAIKYIKEHVTEKIDLDKIADVACMSRSSFYKKFKETTGETPSQYVIQERIKLAQQRLEVSNCSVTQVCFDCGFENLSHFIRTFKKETGQTPKSYQNLS